MRFFFLSFFYFSRLHSYELLAVTPVFETIVDETSIALATTGAVLTLSVQPYDERTRAVWMNHQQMSPSAANFGDLIGSGFAGVLITSGQYFFDSQEANWKSHARTLIWQTTAVYAMKLLFGRKRPGGSTNYQSFPSGHTATAFATATSLTYSYGWPVGIVAYPLAVFTAASRLADDKHWGSDVVAGAFVGIIIARACAEQNLDSGQNSLTPIINPEFSGFNYLYSF